MIPVKSYLGDSVYAEFDGYGMTLTTENGLPDDPSNHIYLEADVIQALLILWSNFRAIGTQEEQ